MATAHKNIPDAQLHEPKGVAGASANRVYVSNGSGSGSWTTLPATSVSVADTADNFSGSTVETVLAELYTEVVGLTGVMADVSTASTVLIPIPYDCTVQQINFVLGGGITVADANVSVTRADGAAMGSQVIAQSGSTEGGVFEFTPSGNNVFTYASHKYVKIVSDGASTTTAPLYILVLISRS